MTNMSEKSNILELIYSGAHFNIIGDSLAAGAGSSKSYKTDEVIFKDGDDIFLRRIAPNSWWGMFERYLVDNYPKCTITNNGCGGVFSYQILNNLENIISDNDDIIFLMLGTNDRKRLNGMNELYENTRKIIRYIKSKNKMIVLFTPTPSSAFNESYPNRIYHMEDVANVLYRIGKEENILVVDNYSYIQNYLFMNRQVIDDIIMEESCANDGLHPSDFVQKLMFENLIKKLEL